MNYQYIITCDLRTISNAKLGSKDHKYREPANISWQEAKTQIVCHWSK